MRFSGVDLRTSPGSDPGSDPGPDPGPDPGSDRGPDPSISDLNNILKNLSQTAV